jgi:prolyl-tRNA editing enzyme YbaK/EbsC (Cys-tRNA(Pro) deacylase)
MSVEYHRIVNKIENLLKENDCWYEKFEHQAVRTSEEAAKVRPDYSLAQGAKAMIVRVKINNSEKKMIMLVVPGDVKFDQNKVKDFFKAKDIRFASETEVSNLTGGVQPGGVPPFGNLFNLETIVDPSLFINEKIIFNAGDKRVSVAMKSVDYQKVVEPKVEIIV